MHGCCFSGEVIAGEEKNAFNRSITARMVRDQITRLLQVVWLLILFLAWRTNSGKRGSTMVPWMVWPE